MQVKCLTRMGKCFLFWWPENDIDKPIIDCRTKSRPLYAVSSPICANCTISKITAINGQPNNRNLVQTVTSRYYVDEYIGLTSGGVWQMNT